MGDEYPHWYPPGTTDEERESGERFYAQMAHMSRAQVETYAVTYRRRMLVRDGMLREERSRIAELEREHAELRQTAQNLNDLLVTFREAFPAEWQMFSQAIDEAHADLANPAPETTAEEASE